MTGIQWRNCDEDAREYIERKKLKHRHNKDNRPFTKRELRLMYFAFKAGFDHKYWKLRKALESE